jgi:hypothetical protein
MKQFYDFSTKKEFNPLEGVELAFINPWMPDSASKLNLSSKVTPDEFITTYNEKGQVINLFPLKNLKLGKCMIKWQDINHGIIYITNSITVYFCIENEVMRINTIL